MLRKIFRAINQIRRTSFGTFITCRDPVPELGGAYIMDSDIVFILRTKNCIGYIGDKEPIHSKMYGSPEHRQSER